MSTRGAYSTLGFLTTYLGPQVFDDITQFRTTTASASPSLPADVVSKAYVDSRALPPGLDGQVAFNSGNAFAGSTGLVFDSGSNTLVASSVNVSGTLSVASGVVLGGSSSDADASAITTVPGKPLLPPRMSTAQRMAISSPSEGLVVFDTTLSALYGFQSGAWARVSPPRPGGDDGRLAINSSGAFATAGTAAFDEGASVLSLANATVSTATTAGAAVVSEAVLVGSGTRDTSAVIELISTSRGILPPRMTSAQREAISAPAAGLIVFDTDESSLFVFQGGAWGAVTSDFPPGSDETVPFRAPSGPGLAASSDLTYDKASGTLTTAKLALGGLNMNGASIAELCFSGSTVYTYQATYTTLIPLTASSTSDASLFTIVGNSCTITATGMYEVITWYKLTKSNDFSGDIFELRLGLVESDGAGGYRALNQLEELHALVTRPASTSTLKPIFVTHRALYHLTAGVEVGVSYKVASTSSRFQLLTGRILIRSI